MSRATVWALGTSPGAHQRNTVANRVAIIRMLRTFNNNTMGDVCSYPLEVAAQLVEKNAAVYLGEIDLDTQTWDDATGKPKARPATPPAFIAK